MSARNSSLRLASEDTLGGVGRPKTTSWVSLLAAALPLLALALASSAEDSMPAVESDPTRAENNDARWVPALSVFGAVLNEGADARVSTLERGSFDDDALAVFASIGLSGEVSTPPLGALPGRPTLFAHGDVSASFDTTDFIVSEGSPGQITPPDTPIPNPPVPAFKGQGSRTGAEARTLVLSAGAGLAFGLGVWERQLRIKPSLEWLWHETQVTGQVGVVQPLTPPPPGQMGAATCPCRTTNGRSTKTKEWHSLGAGLEIELDAARAGPVMMALYVFGQAHRVLSDRRVEIRGSIPWDDASGNLEFESTYKAEPWRYRLGVGLRFRWLPD